MIEDEPGEFKLPFFRQKDGQQPLGSTSRTEQHQCASLLTVFLGSMPNVATAAGGRDCDTFDVLLVVHCQLDFVNRQTPVKVRDSEAEVLQNIHWHEYNRMVLTWLDDFKDLLERITEPLTMLRTLNTQVRGQPRPEVAAIEQVGDGDGREQLVEAIQAATRGDLKHRYCPQMEKKNSCEIRHGCSYQLGRQLVVLDQNSCCGTGTSSLRCAPFLWSLDSSTVLR